MQHLAIIPDGNRRWAKQNKLASFLGHRQGMEAVKAAIQVCIEKEIPFLSLYTFSLENFNRKDEEKTYLFHDLLINEFPKQVPELIENGVKIRFIGDTTKFPEETCDTISTIEQQTSYGKKLTLIILFCYGARQEIISAIKMLMQKNKDGHLTPDDVNEKIVSDCLWTAGVPDPELIIRTGGVSRISNFLLYQSAYSEFMFLDCFWPDVTKELLKTCLTNFDNIQRNFGK